MSAQGKPVRSGTEIMLRSIGMGEILDAAKSLADSGTLAKILTFADHAESIVNLIEELNANVSAMRAELAAIGPPGPGASAADGGVIEHIDGPVLGPGSNGDTRSEPARHDGNAPIGTDGSSPGVEDAA